MKSLPALVRIPPRYCDLTSLGGLVSTFVEAQYIRKIFKCPAGPLHIAQVVVRRLTLRGCSSSIYRRYKLHLEPTPWRAVEFGMMNGYP